MKAKYYEMDKCPICGETKNIRCEDDEGEYYKGKQYYKQSMRCDNCSARWQQNYACSIDSITDIYDKNWEEYEDKWLNKEEEE